MYQKKQGCKTLGCIARIASHRIAQMRRLRLVATHHVLFCGLSLSRTNELFYYLCIVDKSQKMAVPLSNTKLRVPRGFQGLLRDIAKEVLLMQPNDIYTFAAVYFENLVHVREGIVYTMPHGLLIP